MPTDWKFHAEGAGSGVSTNSGVDGRVKTMTVELDAFRYRRWTEDEDDIRSKGKDPKHMHYDEEVDAFKEFADGAHASFEFDVTDGAAELAAVTPEDGDRLEPRHMMLFPAAERVVEAQPAIDYCTGTLHTLSAWYDDAEDVYVEKLDN